MTPLAPTGDIQAAGIFDLANGLLGEIDGLLNLFVIIVIGVITIWIIWKTRSVPGLALALTFAVVATWIVPLNGYEVIASSIGEYFRSVQG